jgi:hypothetical protein
MIKLYILFSTAIFVTTTFIAKAEPPKLSDIPAIVSLPHTFSLANSYGSIDINRDGIEDFYVEFKTYGGGPKVCYVEGYAPENSLLVEYEMFKSTVMQSNVLPTLGIAGVPFATLVNVGTLVGSTTPSNSYWDDCAYIYKEKLASSPPLQANSSDGLHSGYVGVYFNAGSNNYYGWLNVYIDPDENFVTINSSGYASAPSTPVPAGFNDPLAVPIPLFASILGFGLIGGGAYLRKRKKK